MDGDRWERSHTVSRAGASGNLQHRAGPAEREGVRPPRLAAVLIVRDEAKMLPGCSDPAALRRALGVLTADALLVEVHDAHHSDPYRQWETRLYRPAAAAWTGRVHETLLRPDGTGPARATLPPAAMSLRHLGHSTYEQRIRRAERNLALVRVTLDELTALLAGVPQVVDTAGRRRDPTALRELAALVDRLRVLAPRSG